MNVTLKDSGFQEAANLLLGMRKENRTARRAAVKDVGQMIKKQLTSNRKGGAGLAPLGFISKLLGNHKPWGKKKFVVYVPKAASNNPYAIVTTKGANKTMEEGGEVTISAAFKRYLHHKGVHLRGRGDSRVRVPARPLFAFTWSQVKGKIAALYSERFFYQLNRAVRGRYYRKYHTEA